MPVEDALAFVAEDIDAALDGVLERREQRIPPGVGEVLGFVHEDVPEPEAFGVAELEQLDRASARKGALTFFGLDPARPVLLVTGGSLGAVRINDTVFESAAAILGAGWQVLHITGERSPLPSTTPHGYHVLTYCDRMELAIAAADLVISRAGSGTVSELTALSVAAVYVPLAIGNGEQSRNVRTVVAAGGARVVDNASFTPDWVGRELVPLLLDRAAIARLSARAATVGVRDGTDRMTKLIADALVSASTSANTGGVDS